MFLITRRHMWILFLVMTLGILALGVYGYQQVTRYCGEEAATLQFVGERFLFYMILAALACSIMFLFIMFRSKRIDRELDKMIELNRFQEYSPEVSMRRLGRFGEKLTSLYEHQNKQNRRKTLKIGALTQLNQFLVYNTELPCAVANSTGRILQVSPAFTQSVEQTQADLIDSSIDTVFPSQSIQNILFEIKKTHSSIEKEVEKHKLGCYPIYNRENKISYVVLVLDREASYMPTKKKPLQKKENQASFSSAFRRFIYGRKNMH